MRTFVVSNGSDLCMGIKVELGRERRSWTKAKTASFQCYRHEIELSGAGMSFNLVTVKRFTGS